jgi:transposase
MTEVVYKRTDYIGGQILFEVEPKREALKCATCHSSNVSFRGKKKREFRALPFGSKPVKVLFPVQRLQCHDCGQLRQAKIPFADPHQRYIRSFKRYVLELCQYMTMLDVAKHLKISWDTVKTIQKRELQKRFRKPKLKHLTQIAIDEIAIAKGHKYVTLVLDLKSGAVVYVGDGKGADALKPFWKRLKSSRAKIQAVAMDMAPGYIKAVSTNLPQAKIVFDRFHVMNLYNQYLTTLRRELHSKMKDQSERDVLKGIRWLLLKNPENLDPEKNEKERLEEALKFNQPLATAYYLKDSLREFWECESYGEAARHLDDWIAEAKASEIRQLYGMVNTLENHREGLLNYFLYPISTGPLEGVNNKIKTMKRQAYGFRDYEFFQLKIFTLHQCKYALVG